MQHVEVQTASGRVRGTVADGVASFAGIPYAAPPTGPRRFRAPEPHPPWEQPYDAFTFGPNCPQEPLPGIFKEFATDLPQDLDCLRLNVWAPQGAAGSGLPVLVWIHGGGFLSGSGADNINRGHNFARDGVVCVTLNYRLAAEGFLYLGHLFEGMESSGSYGIADQVAALTWVRDNIASFGGAPDRVTVAGQSAGAYSVATLMGTPSARGLFRQAIAQSGAAHNVISTDTATIVANRFMKLAEVGTLSELQQLPWARSNAVQTQITQELHADRTAERWGELAARPAIFRPVAGTDFLPRRPLEAIRAGSAAGVSLLLGSTRDEIGVPFGRLINEEVVVSSLGHHLPDEAQDLVELYKRLRPGAAASAVAAQLEGDRLFWTPTVRLAEAQRPHAGHVYKYRFDWRAPVHGAAYHTLDIPFVFDTLDCEEAKKMTGPDAPRDLARMIHEAWVSYIVGGAPEAAGMPVWREYDLDSRLTMLLSEAPHATSDPNALEREAWTTAVL